MAQPATGTLQPPPSPAEFRCHCGSLLARLVEGGVELKCRRCKQTTWLPLREEARRGFPRPDRRAHTHQRPEAPSPESPPRPGSRRQRGKETRWPDDWPLR